MFRLLARNTLRLIVLSSLFAVLALAQFEVSPDHFDSQDNKVRQKVAKTQAKSEQPARVPAVAAVSGTAALIRVQRSGGPSTRRAAQHKPAGNLSGNQIAAVRRRHNNKDRPVAGTP
jgi:CBS domain containing-hemolysin-like protein